MPKTETLSPQIIVVEASAGSGKTYALSRRYIQLLLSVTNSSDPTLLRQVLAITFTNKAAFEMKERILEFLKKIALRQLSLSEVKSLLDPMALSIEEASRRAFGIMDELIHYYNFFQVQTIDSFINTLLSGCSFKLGLSATFNIKSSAKDYLELSLDRLIDRASYEKPLRKLFDHFLHQYLFLENRTSWFPKKDMLVLMASLFNQTNMYGYSFAEKEPNPHERQTQTKEILKLCQELRNNLPEKTDGRFKKSLETFLTKSTYGFDIDSLSDYFARAEFPLSKGNDLARQTEMLWQQLRESLGQFCQTESRSAFDGYIAIFQKLSEELTQLARKEDIIFLAELNKKAQSLFVDEGLNVEEIYFRLATRFRHYLIDEFQDTSLLQWKNFDAMVEEALASGGSLFYVGDKKQAIYRFRGGDARLFDTVTERFSGFSSQLQTLQNNFRSQQTIVKFNNQIFSRENLERLISDKENYEIDKKKRNIIVWSDIEKEQILNNFSQAQQIYDANKTKGYVKIEYLEAEFNEDKERLTREKLIGLLNDLQARFSWGDIAILARGNEEVATITGWLLAKGISVDSEQTSNIKENFLIKELITLLKFLESPIDNLNFAAFILGDMFASATDCSQEQIRQFIFEHRPELTKEKRFYLYKIFREKFSEIWDQFFEEFFKNVGLFPLYELLVSILGKFRCLENFPEYQGFFMRLLEVIKLKEDECADINSFLSFFDQASLEDLCVKLNDVDTVKILTIHKSKGLEFPVVIIPFLEMDVKVGTSGQGERPFVVQVSNQHLELIQLKPKYRLYSNQLDELYREEYLKSFLTELNNIYVALTRAACELYAFIPRRSSNSYNLARFLVPDTMLEQGKPSIYTRPTKKQNEIMRSLPIAVPQHWIHFLKDEFVDLKQIEFKEKLARGEVVHFALSCLGVLKEENVPKSIVQAIDQTRQQFPYYTYWDQLSVILKAIVTKKELKPFFFVADGTVFQEKEIVDNNGMTYRLDRLILTKDEAWIVDYKSNREVEKIYQNQVKNYQQIVSKLYPALKVRGFLIYLSELDVEEVI